MVSVFLLHVGTSTEFANKYPVATQRVLRAILKATDLCASQPARVAQLLVDSGYANRYDYTLQSLSEIRYDVWRDYDPEDSLRFYALRMHEAGLIESVHKSWSRTTRIGASSTKVKRELKV